MTVRPAWLAPLPSSCATRSPYRVHARAPTMPTPARFRARTSPRTHRHSGARSPRSRSGAGQRGSCSVSTAPPRLVITEYSRRGSSPASRDRQLLDVFSHRGSGATPGGVVAEVVASQSNAGTTPSARMRVCATVSPGSVIRLQAMWARRSLLGSPVSERMVTSGTERHGHREVVLGGDVLLGEVRERPGEPQGPVDTSQRHPALIHVRLQRLQQSRGV